MRGGGSAPNMPRRLAESFARISERRQEFNGRGCSSVPVLDVFRRREGVASGMGFGDRSAISAAHQDAILGFPHVRDTHGQPDPDGRQGNRKGESGSVGPHPMAKIVRLGRTVVMGGPVVSRSAVKCRRRFRGARLEFHHLCRAVGRRWRLDFHFSFYTSRLD